ncbi:restriction endonuclease [Streptomyces sp. N2-109]|uniref:Restriction endonuclease n=1 Tax=Streptomyces gossypii TaxID=2883101 RepID=A0ABT2JR58_9ACTN|nr:restriction endonuclease [Streptomyces gossypii]MCT2589825.1 restriction endonuclease [Streptomyces gossypii]
MTPAELWASDNPLAGDLRHDLSGRWDTLLLLYSTGLINGVHPSYQVATAFLRAKAAHRPPLKIFQTPRGKDESAVVKDFEALLTRGGGRTQYGYVIRELPPPKESLGFQRHDPVVIRQRADLASFGSISALSDLSDTVPRIHLAVHAELISDEAEPGTVRLLGGRDVQRDGTVAPPTDGARWVRAQREHLLAPGDLVIREIYDLGDPHGLVVAQITEQDLPAAASNTTVVLRPRNDIEQQRIRFAVMFLRTPLARTLAGRSGIHLTVRNLLALPVPQPDEALGQAVNDLEAARLQLEKWQKDADALLESVFTHRSPAQARSEIIDRGRSLRLRVEAASLLDQLGHTVRTRFPYPIASRWRETDARRSAGDLRAAYGAVLDTAEVLLCYVAQVALALGRVEGISFGAVAAIREKLSGGRSGPGFGDWVAVLDEAATSRQLRGLPAEHPLQDIRGLLAGQDATDARQRLYDRRNDQAHLRHVDTIDLPAALQSAFADLTTLIERARFLADSPLLHVTDVGWDSLEKTAVVRYRELMGDHPVVPTRSMIVPSNDLEKGSLYLRDSGHRLHLLRPFLIGQDCPTCRAWSTFHVDRVPKGTVFLKCLEHGHVFKDPSPTVPTALAGAGLL